MMRSFFIGTAGFIFGFCVMSPSANAGQVIDFTIPQYYVGPRMLGMGNAFVGLADDYNALLYNPAGLARLEEGQVNLGIGAGVDSKFQKFYSDIKSTSGSDNTQDMVNLLQANYGNYYNARATIGGFWARPKWGFAIIPVDLSMTLAIHQLGGGALDLIANQDTTIAYGRGWDVHWFSRDRLSFGFTGKLIYRGYYNKQIQAGDLAINSDLMRAQDAQEGLTFDGDFGILYSMKVSNTSFMRFMRPSIGFTVRNIADYGFTTNMHVIDKQSGQAPSLGRRYDVGTAWELPDWWIFKVRALADVRDIGAENFTLKKGSHLGAEFLWKIRSWWQGGWRIGANQGYFTAGFTGKLGIFNLDLATYAEEMGSSETPTASRRYVLKAALDW